MPDAPANGAAAPMKPMLDDIFGESIFTDRGHADVLLKKKAPEPEPVQHMRKVRKIERNKDGLIVKIIEREVPVGVDPEQYARENSHTCHIREIERDMAGLIVNVTEWDEEKKVEE